MPYIRLELPLNVPSAYCKQDSGFSCNRSSSSESSGEVKGESLYSDLASQDAESEFSEIESGSLPRNDSNHLHEEIEESQTHMETSNEDQEEEEEKTMVSSPSAQKQQTNKMNNLQDQIELLLLDNSKPLPSRFNAMFYLRAIGNDSAIRCLIKTVVEISVNFNDLLEHEITHILGQMIGIADHEVVDAHKFMETDIYGEVKDALEKILSDDTRSPVTRHEAGESLAAILSVDSLSLLDKYSSEEYEIHEEVRHTCHVAASKIRWYVSVKNRIENEQKNANANANANENQNNQNCVTISQKLNNRNPFLTVDPAPPLNILQGHLFPDGVYDANDDYKSKYQAYLSELVLEAVAKFTDPSEDLFVRYRCLSTLRNELIHDLISISGPNLKDLHVEIVNALIAGLYCPSSALLRHEVGFNLGQILSLPNIADPENAETRDKILDGLEKSVNDDNEADMVRHESSTGFGECCHNDDRSKRMLEKFAGEDKAAILRDSCIVTLNMAQNNEEWLAAQFGFKL